MNPLNHFIKIDTHGKNDVASDIGQRKKQYGFIERGLAFEEKHPINPLISPDKIHRAIPWTNNSGPSVSTKYIRPQDDPKYIDRTLPIKGMFKDAWGKK